MGTKGMFPKIVERAMIAVMLALLVFSLVSVIHAAS